MRLENHDFFISHYTIDGFDSLNTLNLLPNDTPLDCFIRFYVDQHNHDEYIAGKYFHGSYSWANHKQYLYLYSSLSSFKQGPFSVGNGEKWKITKLTNHQLHLETTHRERTYVVHLYSN